MSVPQDTSRPLAAWAQFCIIGSLSTGAFCAAGLAIDTFVPAGVSAAPPSAAPIPHDVADETGSVETSEPRS